MAVCGYFCLILFLFGFYWDSLIWDFCSTIWFGLLVCLCVCVCVCEWSSYLSLTLNPVCGLATRYNVIALVGGSLTSEKEHRVRNKANDTQMERKTSENTLGTHGFFQYLLRQIIAWMDSLEFFVAFVERQITNRSGQNAISRRPKTIETLDTSSYNVVCIRCASNTDDFLVVCWSTTFDANRIINARDARDTDESKIVFNIKVSAWVMYGFRNSQSFRSVFGFDAFDDAVTSMPFYRT